MHFNDDVDFDDMLGEFANIGVSAVDPGAAARLAESGSKLTSFITTQAAAPERTSPSRMTSPLRSLISTIGRTATSPLGPLAFTKQVASRTPVSAPTLARAAAAAAPSAAAMAPIFRALTQRAVARAEDQVGTPGVPEPALAKVSRDIVSTITGRLTPPLTQANDMLRLAATQREATFEHGTLTNQRAFRSSVLSRLASIERRLPPGSERDRIRTVRVLLGAKR